MKLWPIKVEASPEDRPMIVVNYKVDSILKKSLK